MVRLQYGGWGDFWVRASVNGRWARLGAPANMQVERTGVLAPANIPQIQSARGRTTRRDGGG